MLNSTLLLQPTPEEICQVTHSFLAQPRFANLRFSQIESPDDIRQVMASRVKVYRERLPYMLTQINEDGTDEYDERSLIFAIWHEDTIAASIRLTPYPFESSLFIDKKQLSSYLGFGWEQHFLEWSRLLVDSSLKLPRLASALTIYSGLVVLSSTCYTQYVGYTRQRVRQIFSRFQLEQQSLTFTIPSRGDHPYGLLKGSFINDFYHLKHQLLSR